MRFRYSRITRKRLMDREKQRRNYVRYTVLGSTAFVLLALATWIVLYENQARAVVDWLLDRPIAITSSGYERTAAWKSGQQAYQTLDSALYSAFLNLQVTPDRTQETKPRAPLSGGRWTPSERRITVSGAYSLTECNLEIAGAVTRVGGTVVRAEERARSGDLSLEIAHGGMVTHLLHITRDPNLRRRTGRLAVVIAYTDGDDRKVVEKLSDSTRPITFALLPWVDGADEIASGIARGDHEVIALLPVQPRSFTRNMPRRRSVLPAHSVETNRRIVEDALASLPMASAALRYPVDRVDIQAGVLAPVLDELGKRDLYLLDNPITADGSGVPDDWDGNNRFRVWGILDSVYNPVIISMNLDRASLSALDNTRAVVIADARPHALQVLENRMAQLEQRGIEFVKVSDLVDN